MPALCRLLYVALLLVTACDAAATPLGIGRAASDGQAVVPPLGVTFSRLYVPTVLPPNASRFVELRLAAGEDIDLSATPLYVISRGGIAALPPTIWHQGSVLRLQEPQLTNLDLRITAGEIAVVDAQATMQAYAAWGIAPDSGLHSFVSAARSRGLSAHQSPAVLPYPLDASVAINLDPNLSAACVSADPTIDAQSANAQLACPAAGALLLFSRVQPAGLDTQTGWVEVYNAGLTPVDLHGATLCIDSACGPIQARTPDANASFATGILSAATDPNLNAGALDTARAVVAIGRTAQSDAAISWAARAPSLTALTEQSEVALFAPGVQVGADANSTGGAALDYLRFAAADQNHLPLLQTAHSAPAAAWLAQGLAAPRLAGESQARGRLPAANLGALGWSLSSSPAGTALVDPAMPWTSCSMPQNPALPQDALRLTELAQDTTWRIIITNTGSSAVDSAHYSLQLGDESFALGAPQGPILPGANIWVELSADMAIACSPQQDLCWRGAQTYLKAGALTLLLDGVPVGYLQWTTSAEAAAASATAEGIWPGSACYIKSFDAGPANTRPYRALRLLQNATGQSPADYFVGLPTRP